MKLTENQISEALQQNDLPVTKELVAFELNYAGLIIHAGLVPVEFGFIKGGGYPFNPNLATIEFELNEKGDSRFLIKCAYTEWQADIMIDENGNVYHDYEPQKISINNYLNSFK